LRGGGGGGDEGRTGVATREGSGGDGTIVGKEDQCFHDEDNHSDPDKMMRSMEGYRGKVMMMMMMMMTGCVMSTPSASS